MAEQVELEDIVALGPSLIPDSDNQFSPSSFFRDCA
jgi:hypothetical protein